MAFYDQVHTTKKDRLGRVRTSVDNRKFIYLKGVANTVAGSAVAYDETGASALVDTGVAATIGGGPIAIALAAVDSTSKYGWYGIYGAFTASAGDVADNGTVYATSTAGRLDDAAASIGRVWGAQWRSTDNSAANTATIQLSWPSCGPDLSA